MIIEGILKASIVVKIVISLLTILSVLSWAFIFTKIIYLSKVDKMDFEFLDLFWSQRKIEDAMRRSRDYSPSVIARLCSSALPVMKKDTAYIKKTLDNEFRNIMDDVMKFQTFFATVGSTSPFIGLFGTVWGIMNSFMHIGRTGRAGIEVVAPGIAEALITTALGLFTAIPAVVVYNLFLSRAKKIQSRLSEFLSEFEEIITKLP